MKKLRRSTLLLLAAFTVAFALAQDSSDWTRFDDRLGGLEGRVGKLESTLELRVARLEADVGKLSGVPISLGRIETQLEHLAEKSGSNSTILQTVGLGIILSVITGAIGFTHGRTRKQAQE